MVTNAGGLLGATKRAFNESHGEAKQAPGILIMWGVLEAMARNGTNRPVWELIR